MSRLRYVYQVVTHNGAGVYRPPFRSLPKAREACREIAERDGPTMARIGTVKEFEIQRIEQVTSYSVRYWMRAGKRWELWSPHRTVEQRMPDFMIRSPWCPLPDGLTGPLTVAMTSEIETDCAACDCHRRILPGQLIGRVDGFWFHLEHVEGLRP